MALDGVFLNIIGQEIKSIALDSRIDKISQPSRDTLVISLRWRGGSGRLLLSASSACPRIHFVKDAPENPKSAPMFCMLMRKYLGSGRLIAIRQLGLDRVLMLDFETANEFGDKVTVTLAVEIMGRHSNIIAINAEGKIIDAVKRIGEDISEVRQVLPGMTYTPPPQQNKINITETPTGEILFEITQGQNKELSKTILEKLQGLSPIVCRELAHRVGGGMEVYSREMTSQQQTALAGGIDYLKKCLNGDYSPVVLIDESGKPFDFSFMEITQYGNAARQVQYEDCSHLLERFYSEKDSTERMRQRAGDLIKLLQNTAERTVRKLQSQTTELEQSKNKELLRQYGDLISSNMYAIQKGDRKAVVQNYFEEGCPNVEVPLDPTLSPAQNAQKYYQEYRKADTAGKKLQELIVLGRQELEYLETVTDALLRTTTEAGLEGIREELASQGYLKRVQRMAKKTVRLNPLKYLSSDGFTILCGRNNIQNDRLTLKDSHKTDIWFHTQKIPGSHTVILTEGREVPNRTLEEAAVIAAYNSKARNSKKIPVDFTLIKNIKKPPGAKPGMVIYNEFRTAIVDPDPEMIERLEQK